MVHFRKRLNAELLAQVNELIIEQAQQRNSLDASTSDGDDDGNEPPSQLPNLGKLVLDATCALGDVRYPTDLNLLNQAREKSEEILDQLYAQVRDPYKRRPRTYRQARQDYLKVAKQKRPRRKVMRKAVGKQLWYMRRNLNHIDRLLTTGLSLSSLTRRQYRLLLVIHKLYRQQLSMDEHQRPCR